MSISWISEISTKQFGFVILSQILVFKVHLDKAKTSSSLSLSVSHHYGIGNYPVFLEIVD